MKSVRINASMRSSIARAIRKDAAKQWLDTPAGRRMLELEDEMENAIAEHQAIVVPYADRAILEKYGVGRSGTTCARFSRKNDGSLCANSFRYVASQEFTPAVYMVAGSVCMDSKARGSDTTGDWLAQNRQDNLAEWFHLRETFECEVNKLVHAWETIIGMYTTTRKLFEQHPELLRFAGFMNIEPPRENTSGALAAAEATVKAFGALG
jgi:hypothetical protein